MNRKSILFIVPLIALVLMSCRFSADINGERIEGSGNLKTETREVSGIERVSLEDIGDLTIIQGSEEKLSVEADDNVLPYIITRMQGRELILEIKDGYSVDRDSTVHYTVTVVDLNRVSVSGAGNVTSESLKVNDFTVEVSGAGNVVIGDLQTENLRASASGSGDFDLQGKVNRQEISINGAGNYSAGDLESREADVTINGAGNVTLWVEEELEVRVAGVGNVSYYGKPTISQTISGGGGVKSLGSK